MVWPLGMQWMSIHNTPLPTPLCIQHTSPPLHASHQEINVKLRILFNGEVSRLSVPLVFVCSSKPKIKASSRSRLPCSAMVPVWRGLRAVRSSAVGTGIPSASQASRAWEPLARLWADPWVKSCLAQPVENLADGRGARRSPVKARGP